MITWSKLKVIGRGSYGIVFLAGKEEFGQPMCFFAAKSSLLFESSSLMKEFRILQHFIGCPGIVQCLGYDHTIEKSLPMYNLFLEYAPEGTLSDLICKHGGRIPEKEVTVYTHMLLEGLSCIHNKGFVHCDFKPDNILVFHDGDGGYSLKIADFGLAKLPCEEEFDCRCQNRFRGTPLYMSPESVITGQIAASLDMWSLGCVVVEMLTGKRAWGHEDDMASLLFNMIYDNRTPEIPKDDVVSLEAQDFLSRCFDRDPRARSTADELLKHNFITNKNNIVMVSRNQEVIQEKVEVEIVTGKTTRPCDECTSRRIDDYSNKMLDYLDKLDRQKEKRCMKFISNRKYGSRKLIF